MARFNVAAWGRQSGKSTYGQDKMVYKPLRGPAEGVYWYVLQTYTAAEVMFNRYWRMLRQTPKLLDGKPNESERKVRLPRGVEVFFKSGANHEDLRSETLNGAIIDEVRQQSPDLWPMIIRPMLGRYAGWADFLSTPNGFDHFFDLAEEAQRDTTGEWAFWQAPSTECWWWTEKEIISAKRTMSEAVFAQEIMAEFRDMTAGKAYLSFGSHNLVPFNPFRIDLSHEPHPALPIVVAMDFNLNPMAWTLGQEKLGASYWFSEIHLHDSHTQQATAELIARVRNHKPGVILIGDATGKASQRAAAAKSDYDIIKNALTEAGIKWIDKTPDSNPQVKDRVNTMNANLKSALGTVNIHIYAPGCPELVKDLQRVVWKVGAEATLDQSGKNKARTHASDGVGYAVCVLAPIHSPSSGVTLRIIRR